MVFLDNLLGIVDRGGRAEGGGVSLVVGAAVVGAAVGAAVVEGAAVAGAVVVEGAVMVEEGAAKVVGELDKHQKHK